jgi:para-aminobenzoate synthetase / 4-amino-4-deoxychorismate lyase
MTLHVADPGLSNTALIRDPDLGRWLLFRDPLKILKANTVQEVGPTIHRLEQALKQPGISAAGYIAYEAAPGFDPALKTRALRSMPLIWFGLYPEPQVLSDLPISPAGVDQKPFLTWDPSTTVAEYDRSIAQIKEYIARGATYQVNFTYRLSTIFEREPFPFFLELVRAQNAPYAAFLDTDQFTICSASPELFFRLEGNLLLSRPMKGTTSRGRTLEEDQERYAWLQNSLKDRAENVMIVDMVRNDIGRIAEIGSVQVPELFAIEKYPTVWQMVSTVSGETNAGFGEIFSALFPPASITGAPKVRTMSIISELEVSPRGVYTGCIGFICPERRAQFNVAIRTVVIDKKTENATYGVGGGITWDSVDTAEYEECRAKAKILNVRIPGFQLLESFRWSPGEGYFLLELHLRRLADSAAYFSYPLNLETIRQKLIDQAAGFDANPKKVRLLIDSRGFLTLQAEPLYPFGQAGILPALVSPLPIDSTDPFLYHKTTHRSVYDHAKQAALSEIAGAWEDIILWNERGELTESCTANIMVELDGVCYTPLVSCGLLAGTYRTWLLEQGKVKERILKVADLHRDHRLFLINSVRPPRQVLVQFHPRSDSV